MNEEQETETLLNIAGGVDPVTSYMAAQPDKPKPPKPSVSPRIFTLIIVLYILALIGLIIWLF